MGNETSRPAEPVEASKPLTKGAFQLSRSKQVSTGRAQTGPAVSPPGQPPRQAGAAGKLPGASGGAANGRTSANGSSSHPACAAAPGAPVYTREEMRQIRIARLSGKGGGRPPLQRAPTTRRVEGLERSSDGLLRDARVRRLQELPVLVMDTTLETLLLSQLFALQKKAQQQQGQQGAAALQPQGPAVSVTQATGAAQVQSECASASTSALPVDLFQTSLKAVLVHNYSAGIRDFLLPGPVMLAATAAGTDLGDELCAEAAATASATACLLQDATLSVPDMRVHVTCPLQGPGSDGDWDESVVQAPTEMLDALKENGVRHVVFEIDIEQWIDRPYDLYDLLLSALEYWTVEVSSTVPPTPMSVMDTSQAPWNREPSFSGSIGGAGLSHASNIMATAGGQGLSATAAAVAAARAGGGVGILPPGNLTATTDLLVSQPQQLVPLPALSLSGSACGSVAGEENGPQPTSWLHLRNFFSAKKGVGAAIDQLIKHMGELGLQYRPQGLLIEEPSGSLLPFSLGPRVAAARYAMLHNTWAAGHILLRPHRGYGLSGAAATECLASGCNGVWGAVCDEDGCEARMQLGGLHTPDATTTSAGAVQPAGSTVSLGSMSYIVPLFMLARLGNTHIARMYNLPMLREAAAHAFQIIAGAQPSPRTELYGSRALDVIFDPCTAGAGGAVGIAASHMDTTTRANVSAAVMAAMFGTGAALTTGGTMLHPQGDSRNTSAGGAAPPSIATASVRSSYGGGAPGVVDTPRGGSHGGGGGGVGGVLSQERVSLVQAQPFSGLDTLIDRLHHDFKVRWYFDAAYLERIADSMLEVVLLNKRQGSSRQDFNNIYGLAMLWERAGGDFVGEMVQAVLGGYPAEKRLQQVQRDATRRWKQWEQQQVDAGMTNVASGFLDVTCFYTAFMASYFGSLTSPATIQALRVVDCLGLSCVSWYWFCKRLKWALHLHGPRIHCLEDAVKVVFEKLIIPQVHEMQYQAPQRQGASGSTGMATRQLPAASADGAAATSSSQQQPPQQQQQGAFGGLRARFFPASVAPRQLHFNYEDWKSQQPQPLYAGNA